MNFVTILATMAAFWHRGSGQNQDRRGKFLGMSSEDLWSDILDEVNDPLPFPTNTISVRDQVLKKIKKEQSTKTQQVPLPPLPAQIIQGLATPPPPPMLAQAPKPAPKPVRIEPDRRRNVSSPAQEPMMVYDSVTNKFELTPPGFASHPNPMTESLFLIGGQFGQHTERPPHNMTVNVPELISAMAAFFTERFPFINRHPDQNSPRPNAKLPDLSENTVAYYPEMPIDNNLLEYRQMEPPRSRKNKKKQKKKRKKNKQKRKTTTEGYQIKGSYTAAATVRPTSRTWYAPATKAPKNQVTQKAWFSRTTLAPSGRSTTEDAKLFHHNNNPGSEQYKIKNMPITRHVTRYADKELFNFKHSDISNSPIMILNMPSRPVVMYKYKTDLQHHYPAP